VRGRIENTLDYAKAHGLRSGENPARWRGHLALILPKQIGENKHYKAMPFADVPGFVRRLRTDQFLSALALEFIILTAVRTNEALGARWAEIDLEK
jgi:integrase